MGTERRLLGYELAVFCILKLFVSITRFIKNKFINPKFYKTSLKTCSSKVYSKRAPGQELEREVLA